LINGLRRLARHGHSTKRLRLLGPCLREDDGYAPLRSIGAFI
jgi:hypothetical protein